MKKTLLNLIFAMIISSAYAQDIMNVNLSDRVNNRLGVASVYVYNANSGNIDGSIHLFDSWNNFAVIFSNDNETLSLKNINLNIQKNVFESKISDTEIFTFNVENVVKVVINNRVFKNYLFEGENMVFEVVYEKDDLEILKGYNIKFIEGNPDPLVNRPNDRYSKSAFYALKDNNIINSFKFKKKNVLKLVGGDKDVAKLIMDKAKL